MAPDKQTARKEISLGLSRKKYKRLEADMFRSRTELANTLCEAEKDHQRHELEMKRAEEQTKELEVALRAADEVGTARFETLLARKSTFSVDACRCKWLFAALQIHLCAI